MHGGVISPFVQVTALFGCDSTTGPWTGGEIPAALLQAFEWKKLLNVCL